MNLIPEFKNKHYVVEEIYSFLKKNILEGDFEPGSRLYIDRISRQIGVSRMPIREAIKQLEVEGLVCSIPRKGPAVNVVSSQEIEEIQGIRAELESYAGRLAIDRISDKEISLLEAIETRIEKIVKKRSSAQKENPDWKTLHRLNLQFHSFLIKCSGNKKLFQMMDNLNNYLYRINMMIYNMPGTLPIAVDDHQKIIHAIKHKNHTGVEKIIRSHIMKGKELLLKVASDGQATQMVRLLTK